MAVRLCFRILYTNGVYDMNNWKLFYCFSDPLGANDCKIGITSHPANRLGNYQNSYSRNSHVACFHLAYIGTSRVVSNLETQIKFQLNWNIERDGYGVSEWISNWSCAMIEEKIDQVIDGFKFKIQKIDPKFLPLTVDNMDEFLEHYILEPISAKSMI